jgi:putative multiple sugar transport system substrate-binding protein
VLSPYDGLSIGIISALKGVGYGTKDQPMPIISGQDAEVPSVKSIINGRAVFDDLQGHPRTRQGRPPAWSTRCFPAKPEINDTKTYNNGVKVVPSYLLKPVAVDATNWKPAPGRHRLLQGRASSSDLN